MSHKATERRKAPRHSAEQHGVARARIRPGHHVKVIDLSPVGAFVETDRRLLPGTSVDLHVQSDHRHATMRGRVVRCSVVRVRAASMCYRGAIAFDRHLPWFTDVAGYEIPSRGDVTP
jgi:hypothetical protein